LHKKTRENNCLTKDKKLITITLNAMYQILSIKEIGPNGEIQFTEEELQTLQWKEGDDIEITLEQDGTIFLNKKPRNTDI
jgi:hypothetical protein